MERLLIDTDPGVDDAQAILLAAAHPQTRIEALLAVGGNVGMEHTGRNALMLSELLGGDIPVYFGCAEPLVARKEHATAVHGADGLGDAGWRPRKVQPEAEHAATALVRLARAEPGAFTLVAIGPLTNIAVALKLEPALPRLLKRCVIMGGAVTAGGNTMNLVSEFNIFADPEAGQMVFNAWGEAGRLIELLDWEATMRHGIPLTIVEEWKQIKTEKSRFFHEISARTLTFFKEKFGVVDLYGADPLALAVAVEPTAVTRYEDRYVTVELGGNMTRGQTIVDWGSKLGKAPNCRIVMDLDMERFVALMEAGLR
jgi:purine nucleosidase